MPHGSWLVTSFSICPVSSMARGCIIWRHLSSSHHSQLAFTPNFYPVSLFIKPIIMTHIPQCREGCFHITEHWRFWDFCVCQLVIVTSSARERDSLLSWNIMLYRLGQCRKVFLDLLPPNLRKCLCKGKQMLVLFTVTVSLSLPRVTAPTPFCMFFVWLFEGMQKLKNKFIKICLNSNSFV